MSERYGVIGPLYEPASRSGVHLTDRELSKSGPGSSQPAPAIPPCMRPGWTPEKHRAQEAEWAAQRRTYLATTHTDAEEAS